MSLHRQRVHPVEQDDCFGCRVSTVRVGVSSEVAMTERREKVLRKDLDSYKRLRGEGMQPAHVRGSYESEQRADTRLEVENPRLRGLPAEAKPYVNEMVQAATEIPASISRFKDQP